MLSKNMLRMIFILFPILILCGCSHASDPISKSGFYFNTVISITLYDTTDTSLLDGCFSVCESFEQKLSRTIEGSDVFKINHSNGNPTVISEDTALLLKTALEYCTLTEGSIDITVAPLSELWNFSSETPHSVPSSSDIKKALSYVNYQNIILQDNTVTLKNANTQIDLGFIAKGYIADKIKEYLLTQNVKSALINLGGNVLTIGEKPDHTAFKIGIQKPFDNRNSSITSVETTDSSVVSSGVYERYFMENEKLYHHILNPQTGYPYENNLLGVTILSKTSMEGDALSTTCFALGLEDGMTLIESLPDVEAIFITDDNQLHYSSGYKPY